MSRGKGFRSVYMGVVMITSNKRLVMGFVGFEAPELCETLFIHPLNSGPKRCIRGKSAGAYSGYSTFQWTKAVQAVSLLVMEALIRSKTGDGLVDSSPMLSGYRKSLASSLDQAMDKHVLWLSDMFGCDQRGNINARRLILRSNASLKRPGPVALSLNLEFLPADCIDLYLNRKQLQTADELRALRDTLWQRLLRSESEEEEMGEPVLKKVVNGN